MISTHCSIPVLLAAAQRPDGRRFFVVKTVGEINTHPVVAQRMRDVGEVTVRFGWKWPNPNGRIEVEVTECEQEPTPVSEPTPELTPIPQVPTSVVGRRYVIAKFPTEGGGAESPTIAPGHSPMMAQCVHEGARRRVAGTYAKPNARRGPSLPRESGR